MTFQKNFGAALNAIQFLIRPKKIGMSQNILGPVKGKGIVFELSAENTFFVT